MSLFPQPITVIRSSRTPDGKGRWNHVDTRSTLTGVNGGTIQPATMQNAGRYIQSRPEGRRDVGCVVVYTRANLHAPLEGSETAPDCIVWQGAIWEIVQKEAHMGIAIPHAKYYAEYKGPDA